MTSQQKLNKYRKKSKKLSNIIFDLNTAEMIEKELGIKGLEQGFEKNKSQSFKYAWGNLTYAEMIERAIETSPQKRLTLSQIYQWIITYVPYFKNKADDKTSYGWKNSVRHNLSLHKHFMRIQSAEADKNSFWIVDSSSKNTSKKAVRKDNDIDKISKLAYQKIESEINGNYYPGYILSNSIYDSSPDSEKSLPFHAINSYTNDSYFMSTSYESDILNYQRNAYYSLSQYDHHAYSVYYRSDAKQNNNNWNLDINAVIKYERDINGGELDLNKDNMFPSINN